MLAPTLEESQSECTLRGQCINLLLFVSFARCLCACMREVMMAVYTCDFDTILHLIVFVSSTVIIAIDRTDHVFHRKSRATSVRAS